MAATAAEISKTFTAAQVALDAAQVECLADEIRRYGSLANTIAALRIEADYADYGSPVRGSLKVAEAYERALREQADPHLKVKRFRTHAADLREQAGRSADDAADYLKMARARLDAGNADSTYRNLLASYRAAAQQSGDLIKQALAVSDEAARIELEAVQAETGRLTASNTSMKAA
jgi:hypothetical protein